MYQEHLWWLRSNGLAALSFGLSNYGLNLNYGQKMTWIKPNSQRPSTQKPACFMTLSPLIPIKTKYQVHLWWLRSNGKAALPFCLLNYGPKMTWFKPTSPRPSTQKPACFMT
jgi:hypothetical protein